MWTSAFFLAATLLGVPHAGIDACHRVVFCATQWSFDASCMVRCQDGACKQFCTAGIVVATDEGSARLQAQARVRTEAAQNGLAVVGEISVSVRIK